MKAYNLETELSLTSYEMTPTRVASDGRSSFCQQVNAVIYTRYLKSCV